jgi:hypothetical protein
MPTRKTIRPVTLRRVIEACIFASRSEAIDASNVSKEIGVSESRAEEIILELERMRLVSHLGSTYVQNARTAEFLEYFRNDQWRKIHEYFLKNYQFYGDFFSILKSHAADLKGLTADEIMDEGKTRQLRLNQTAVDVLSDWSDRLGAIQRHLYTRRIYPIEDKVETEIFRNALVKLYQELSKTQGRKGIFVEIPIMREDLCERLKIARKTFDEMLHNTYLENVGRMELSGAPIITRAKKSPLSEKKIKRDGKIAVLAPKNELQREREGLLVGRKIYYYMAVYEGI